KNNLVQGNHCAVFCDESQDFTRVEFEIIHRMSLFARRLITPEHANRVPIVFAGDPFQTLNPTGFRWEAIKAALIEKIVLSLNPLRAKGGRPDLNYRELSYNYRSTEHIVKLCNTIQALRAILFPSGSLQPQTCWKTKE